MARHRMYACAADGDGLCGACEKAIDDAEFERDHGHEADSFGWAADRQADREERQRDAWWG